MNFSHREEWQNIGEVVRMEGSITTHASITANPFFEKRGYQVAKEQQVERQGIFLTNYVMIKE